MEAMNKNLMLTLRYILAAAILGPTTAAAQDDYEQQVLSQLQSAREYLESDGYEHAGDWTGTLEPWEDDAFTLPQLEAGYEYLLVAACDLDCDDIDLYVWDDSPREVAADEEPDDFPMVGLTPEAGRSYEVQVSMVGCLTEPCFYGVSLFRIAADTGTATEDSYTGTLGADNNTLAGGEYYSEYTFQGRVGEQVTIELESDEFDTFLVLEGPADDCIDRDSDGPVQFENDDADDETTNSRIDTRLNQDGEWTVLVTSYAPLDTGDYTLRITRRQ